MAQIPRKRGSKKTPAPTPKARGSRKDTAVPKKRGSKKTPEPAVPAPRKIRSRKKTVAPVKKSPAVKKAAEPSVDAQKIRRAVGLNKDWRVANDWRDLAGTPAKAPVSLQAVNHLGAAMVASLNGVATLYGRSEALAALEEILDQRQSLIDSIKAT